ncbi:DinB family protein [Luteitalea sp.]|uniref:DinB family protein n=1 Tax=Luteitalea sp. TaxID=2004800 RepID=UPI0025B9050A|nr:DinB family protein [Luteitalea sp.]
MTPEQATFLAQQFAQLMEGELPITLKVLRAVPESGRDYRPDAKSRSAWELATHLAQSDVWFLDCILAGAFSVDKDAAAAQIAGFATVDDVVGFYERAMPLRLAGLREASGEDMARLVDFFGMMKRPAATLLGLANNHGIHHRGQLAAYLRASGSTVPAIYGDSADEPM